MIVFAIAFFAQSLILGGFDRRWGCCDRRRCRGGRIGMYDRGRRRRRRRRRRLPVIVVRCLVRSFQRILCLAFGPLQFPVRLVAFVRLLRPFVRSLHRC